MNGESGKTLPCPRCGTVVIWNETARWKPFCSERCKLIDLGAWFTEEHGIPGEPLEKNDDAGHKETGDKN